MYQTDLLLTQSTPGGDEGGQATTEVVDNLVEPLVQSLDEPLNTLPPDTPAIPEAHEGTESQSQLLNQSTLALLPEELIGSEVIDGVQFPTQQPVLIQGTSLADELFGTDGNDLILGLEGWDILNGGAGNDSLEGAEGRDSLIGGAGDDTLVGGLDSDYLIGDNPDLMGGGRDQFVYNSFSERTDRILDFKANEDSLVLTNVMAEFGYQGNNPVADGYLRFVQQGANTRVQVDPDGVSGPYPFMTLTILENATATDLIVGFNVIV